MFSVAASVPLRFRQNGAVLVAVLIAVAGTLPIATISWAFAPLLLVPLAVAGWAWRSGTDIDEHELRVRAMLGTRHIPWTRVTELAADPRGGVSALLTDGHVIRLTAMRARDLRTVTQPEADQPG
ncbi:MAG TPA: PH domain-containing protein [Actinoplanes sp.]|nr:PH domain-containing protein [Actinoplanes sp.]